MNTTEIERRIRGLNDRIASAEQRAQSVEAKFADEADGLIRSGAAKREAHGALTFASNNPDVRDHLARRESAMGEIRDELASLVRERAEAMAHMSKAFDNAPRSLAGRRPLPLLPSAQDMAMLREAAMGAQTFRVPSSVPDMFDGGMGFPSATVTPSTLPPAQRPDYRQGVFGTLYEPTRVASVIPMIATERPIVDYYRTTTGATAAASVAAGDNKPESSPVSEQVTATIVKLAHYGKVQDEVVKDYGQWESFIGVEFISGLVHEENRQLLSADGTGTDMVGLLNTPSVLTYDRDATNESKLDAIAAAITALRNGDAFCAPDAIIVHPTDFLDMRLSKADSAGIYLAGDPLSGEADSLWGVPVVQTTQCTQGYAIVANFQIGATIYWREFPTFEVARGQGEDEWKANLTLVRAEERLVLAVQRPKAICKVTLF